MAGKKYRLQPVLNTREQAKREAERLLAARMAQLAEAEEALRAAAEEQRGVVARCEAELERARAALVEAAREVRVIEKHRENWTERERREAARREQKINDEIGAILHERRSSE